jgi:ABC-type sulfate/molybdate transport systems ATPase subunit
MSRFEQLCETLSCSSADLVRMGRAELLAALCSAAPDDVARALVARPRILLFDDSFSALDVATDARLRGALDDGPTAVSGLMSKLADFDLIDRLLLIHQGGGQLSGNLTDVGAIDEVLVDPRVVPMTAQARDAFRVLDHELLIKLRLSRGTGFSSILARIEENATKLALIRAVSRDAVTPQIEDHDAHWGIALSRHCAELTIREASARVSENQVESNHKRALQILRDGQAAGMSKSEFTRRTQFMDHRQRDGVLRTLTDAHLVEVFAKPTGGRPSQWIKLAGADE